MRVCCSITDWAWFEVNLPVTIKWNAHLGVWKWLYNHQSAVTLKPLISSSANSVPNGPACLGMFRSEQPMYIGSSRGKPLQYNSPRRVSYGRLVSSSVHRSFLVSRLRWFQRIYTMSLSPHNAKIYLHKPWRTKGYFQFEIIYAL